jgi:uncharacterized membrane protein (UPF0127 family)
MKNFTSCLVFAIICVCLIGGAQAFANQKIPLELEFAKTEEARGFGLMQRRALNENQGMLFFYSKPQIVNVWMFNCFINLSVAFLDEKGVIREIHELQAYPEKMKFLPPIKTYGDVLRYSTNNSVADFFYKKRLKSTFKTSFLLEMNAKWFYNAHIIIGDTITWDENTGVAFAIKNM